MKQAAAGLEVTLVLPSSRALWRLLVVINRNEPSNPKTRELTAGCWGQAGEVQRVSRIM